MDFTAVDCLRMSMEILHTQATLNSGGQRNICSMQLTSTASALLLSGHLFAWFETKFVLNIHPTMAQQLSTSG